MRTTRDPRRADEWGLVLTARGIGWELQQEDGELRLWTLPGDLERATAELDAYDRENRVAPPRAEAPNWGRTGAGLGVAWAILASFGATAGRSDLVMRGSARAESILAGEWWRTVTALTLHADLPHAVGNAAAAGVFVSLAAWRFGPGMTVLVTLGAGIFGNLLTASFYEAHHSAIGSSTAMFGTLGLLTALSLHDARRFRVRVRAPWVLVGASFALLGMLGTSEGSDVLAHAAGWLCGLLFGLAAVVLRPAPLRPLVQWALLLGSAAVLAAAWLVA